MNIKKRCALIKQVAKASVRRSNYFVADQFKQGMLKEKKYSTLPPDQQQKVFAIIDEECNKKPDYSVTEIIKLGQVLKKRLTTEVKTKNESQLTN